jgi:hypothetical protein
VFGGKLLSVNDLEISITIKELEKWRRQAEKYFAELL